MENFYHTKTEVFINGSKVYQCRNNFHSKIIAFAGFLSRLEKNIIEKIKFFDDSYIILHKNSIGVIERKVIDNSYKYRKIKKFDNYSVLDFGVICANNKIKILYGEYKRNDDFKKVSLYALNIEDGEEEKIFEFDEGLINHIHAVIPYKNQLIVLTGDFGENVGMYFISENKYGKYEVIKKLVDGQKFRAAWGYIVNDTLYFATDSQINQNFLKKINLKNYDVEVLSSLESSSIYSYIIGTEIFFSTVVEPRKFEKRSVFNYLSQDYAFNEDKYYLYKYSCIDESLVKIKSKRKNLIPSGISGFGTYRFTGVYGNNPITVHAG